MVLERGCWWPYCCSFMGCCFQDISITSCNILLQLPSYLFSIHFVSIQAVHPYSNMYTIASRKKIRFILSDRSDLQMTDNLSIAVYAFASRVLLSFSVDEMLLQKYVNLSISFRGETFSAGMSLFFFFY